MNLRPGQKMELQSCRYCHGSGTVTMTRAFIHGHRDRATKRCTHIVGDPYGENGRP